MVRPLRTPHNRHQGHRRVPRRYICRIGLSKKKVHYDHVHQHITLTYNDYRKQKTGQAAPKAQKKLQPLLAIHYILQHVLPPYFQKCRYYGLHTSSTYKKHQASIPPHLKRNQQTVRTLFQILKAMLGVEKVQCEDCNKPHLIKSLYRLIIPGYQKTLLVTISEVHRLAHISNMITHLARNITSFQLSSGTRMSYFMLNLRTDWLMFLNYKRNLSYPIIRMSLSYKSENALKSSQNSIYLGWNVVKSIQHG